MANQTVPIILTNIYFARWNLLNGDLTRIIHSQLAYSFNWQRDRERYTEHLIIIAFRNITYRDVTYDITFV